MTDLMLNRVLVVMMICLMVLDLGGTFWVGEDALAGAIGYLFVLPLVLALLGKGGKWVYYAGLAVALVLGFMLLLFFFLLIMDVSGLSPIDYYNPVSVAGVVFLFFYGVYGAVAFSAVRASHPESSVGQQSDVVAKLWVGLILSILFAVIVNFAIMLFAITQEGWSYSEIIWIYYLEALAFLIISSTVMTKHDTEKSVVKDYLLAGGIFMMVYAGLFVFVLVPPAVANLPWVVLVAIAFFALHWNDFRMKLRVLEDAALDSEALERSLGLRLVPLHLTAGLAILFFFADDRELASASLMLVFILLKTLVDVILEISNFVRERRLVSELSGT